jgi:aspartyl-tRNA synthetase
MKRTLIKETVSCVGETVRLCGWVKSVRSHGKISFIDLRDQSGIVQVVGCFDLKTESVVEIIGEVKQRPERMINPDLETGTIEIEAKEINVLSESKVSPFDIDSDGRDINEEIRLKYRYIDLRRERMQNNLKQRFLMSQFCRNFLAQENFIEVETPYLSKSTPEGARDFLVPSRREKGLFYALPQSPQQYKQLLISGGVEKYFQFARCFRDEDTRANRQAEFVQLDIEMAFVEREDVLNFIEKMFTSLVKQFFPDKKITTPFPRMTYQEAMEKYGNDRPDIRKNENELAFLFVIDFPLFEKKDGKWDSVHHPFTRSQEKDFTKNPNGLSWQYDLVLNGDEIAGGSLRFYRSEDLINSFKILGYSEKEIKDKFNHLLEAFDYGIPPHGGIAVGWDRFVSLVLGESNIREVMAFPKTGDGRDLMIQTPSEIDKEQLNELGF